ESDPYHARGRDAADPELARSRRLSGNGPPPARYTPTEITAIALQSASTGHSPSSGIAIRAAIAGTRAANDAAREAPKVLTARAYRYCDTTTVNTPWTRACSAMAVHGAANKAVPVNAT